MASNLDTEFSINETKISFFLPLYDPTIDAVNTLTTIGEKRVVRAEQDGRGTLLPSRRFSVPPAR